MIHAETSLSEKNDKKETIPGEGTFGCGNEADPQRSNPRACACVPVMKYAAPGVTGDGPLPMEGQPGVIPGSWRCSGARLACPLIPADAPPLRAVDTSRSGEAAGFLSSRNRETLMTEVASAITQGFSSVRRSVHLSSFFPSSIKTRFAFFPFPASDWLFPPPQLSLPLLLCSLLCYFFSSPSCTPARPSCLPALVFRAENRRPLCSTIIIA